MCLFMLRRVTCTLYFVSRAQWQDLRGNGGIFRRRSGGRFAVIKATNPREKTRFVVLCRGPHDSASYVISFFFVFIQVGHSHHVQSSLKSSPKSSFLFSFLFFLPEVEFFFSSSFEDFFRIFSSC